MALILKDGKLLIVDGKLAVNENCCCTRNFLNCYDCLITLQGLNLSISGYTDGTDDIGGDCMYSAINGNYALTIPCGLGCFRIILGQAVDCNLGDRGIHWYHRQDTDGRTTDIYVSELLAQVSCGPTDSIFLQRLSALSWSVRQPAGGNCIAGFIPFPMIEPVSAVLGFSQTQPDWQDFCSNDAAACWHRTPNGHPFYNFFDCNDNPMDVDACVTGVF